MCFFFPFEKAAVQEQPSRGQHLLSSAPDFFWNTLSLPSHLSDERRGPEPDETRSGQTNQVERDQPEEASPDGGAESWHGNAERDVESPHLCTGERYKGHQQLPLLDSICMHLDVNFLCLSSSPDLETSQKLVENEKKSIEELIRERDALSKVRTCRGHHSQSPASVQPCLLHPLH